MRGGEASSFSVERGGFHAVNTIAMSDRDHCIHAVIFAEIVAATISTTVSTTALRGSGSAVLTDNIFLTGMSLDDFDPYSVESNSRNCFVSL